MKEKKKNTHWWPQLNTRWYHIQQPAKCLIFMTHYSHNRGRSKFVFLSLPCSQKSGGGYVSEAPPLARLIWMKKITANNTLVKEIILTVALIVSMNPVRGCLFMFLCLSHLHFDCSIVSSHSRDPTRYFDSHRKSANKSLSWVPSGQMCPPRVGASRCRLCSHVRREAEIYVTINKGFFIFFFLFNGKFIFLLFPIVLLLTWELKGGDNIVPSTVCCKQGEKKEKLVFDINVGLIYT